MKDPDKKAPESGQPNESGRTQTYYSDSPYYLVDGPEDTTVRPLPPNIPRYWPQGIPFPEPKSPPPEEEGGQSS